ncbi:MAG: hypothetical protein R3E89_04740 [Thiolinea sp.]
MTDRLRDVQNLPARLFNDELKFLGVRVLFPAVEVALLFFGRSIGLSLASTITTTSAASATTDFAAACCASSSTAAVSRRCSVRVTMRCAVDS